MKKTIIFIFLLFIVFSVSAQRKNIHGRILDKDSLSVPGVAVIMQTLDSVYINAGVSDLDGYFMIESTTRPYRLLIQHIAYKPFSIESSKDNIGTLFLTDNINELESIVVKATRPILKVDDGKLSYDLKAIKQKKLIDNTYDLLKELPSITNSNNSLSIVGNMGGTEILISGRKSNMSYEQMLEYLHSLPSERVEKIEIAYNPPASWHVKGSAINIILKEEKTYSLQGQLQGSYTNQYANSYKSGGSLFLSSPKLSVDIAYNFNDNRVKTINNQKALHTVGGETYDIQTDMTMKDRRQYHNLYSAFRYDFNKNNLVELSYVGQYAPKSNSVSENKNNYFSNAFSSFNKSDYLHNIALTYTSPFGLKTGAEYTNFQNDGIQSLQYQRESGIVNALSYNMMQQINKASFFADMSHSLPKGFRLTYGIKYDYTRNNNTQQYEDIEHNGQGNYKQNSKTEESSTDINIGLSKSFFSGKLNTSISAIGEIYKINDYKKNVFLPNVMMVFTPNEKHSLQFAYQTFRMYPSYWERQEYTTYKDEYNVSVGNSELRPVKFSMLNLLYVLRGKYMLGVQWQKANDFFISQTYQSPDELLNINQTCNIDFYTNLIFTAIIPVNIGKIWSMNIVGNVLRERYKTSRWFDLSYDRQKWVGLINIYNTLTISEKPRISLNIRAFYKSPFIQGIWDFSKTWGINSGIKWEIIKDKAILTLQCNDWFNSQLPIIYSRYANQHLDMDYTACQRSLIVKFSYNFKGYKNRQEKNVDTSRYGL